MLNKYAAPSRKTTFHMAFNVNFKKYLAIMDMGNGEMAMKGVVGRVLDKGLPLKKGEQIYRIEAGEQWERSGHVIYERITEDEKKIVMQAWANHRALFDWGFMHRVFQKKGMEFGKLLEKEPK